MPSKLTEGRTRASSSEEENHLHMLVDDAILKDIQMTLERLNVLHKINQGLIRIESDINSVRPGLNVAFYMCRI